MRVYHIGIGVRIAVAFGKAAAYPPHRTVELSPPKNCAITSVVAALLVTDLVGCNMRQKRVDIPRVDASGAGNIAIEQYDRDDDQMLSKGELESCPSILTTHSEYDVNGDALISAEEISQRIGAWQDTRVGFVTGYTCNVRYNGRPLKGATVRLTPEPFLGGAIKPASGVSNSAGIALLSIAEEDLPNDLRGLRGVQFGLYKVHITHPTKEVADRYNTNSLLGCEIYPSGDPETLTYNIGPN